MAKDQQDKRIHHVAEVSKDYPRCNLTGYLYLVATWPGHAEQPMYFEVKLNAVAETRLIQLFQHGWGLKFHKNNGVRYFYLSNIDNSVYAFMTESEGETAGEVSIAVYKLLKAATKQLTVADWVATTEYHLPGETVSFSPRQREAITADLFQALVTAAVKECDRAVQQALRNDGSATRGQLYDTCFGRAFAQIVDCHNHQQELLERTKADESSDDDYINKLISNICDTMPADPEDSETICIKRDELIAIIKTAEEERRGC